MASLALTAALILNRNADEHAALINQSGQQRMLSQQIALLAHSISVTETTENQNDYLAQLEVALNSFEASQLELSIARERQAGTSASFHSLALILERDTGHFIESVQSFVENSTYSTAAVLHITDDAMQLLPLLNESTRAFELYANNQIATLRRVEVAAFASTLVLLFLEVLLIFRPMTRQILKSYEERDQAAKRAERANEAKTEFLATMSHEIRTPLHCIMGMAELLKQEGITKSALTKVGTLEEAANGLLRLVNEILDFSKLTAGMMTLDPHPTKIRSVIAPIMNGFHGMASKKGLILTTNIEVTVPDELHMDGYRFGQILTNLVGNSIKFTDEGHVDVTVKQDSDLNTILTVRDTGTGISKEDIPSLFKQFHQSNMSITKSHEGTGLGLAIVKRLVDLMGGKIGITSEVGIGTRIWCNLPFRADQNSVETDETFSKSSILAKPDYDALSNKRALIIDDMQTNLLVCSSLLESKNMDTACSESGEAGFAKASAENFDIILIDLHMPGMSGLDCIKKIRDGNGPNNQAPIIVLTADVGEHVIDDALAAGADGVTTKPFTIEGLAGMMIPYLERESS